MTGTTPDNTFMKKFLIIQTASIGDVILATPVAEKLHRFYPDAQVSLLVKKGNEALFAGHPFLHEVIVWDKSRNKYWNLFRVLRRIRKARFDHVINLQRFGSTGFLTACSGASRLTGFDKNPFRSFFTEVVPHRVGEGVHETGRNLRLVESITDPSPEKPRLYPAGDDEKAIVRLVTGNYYTISPASLWFTKQYPAEKWSELARNIGLGSRIYLLGSAPDSDLCDKIIQSSIHPGAVNLAGKLTFLQSAALMQKARMNFTNDSAPLHLASAVNAPVTVVYCSTLPSFGFGPLSDNSAVIEVPGNLYCRPCGLHGLTACPEKHFRCAFDIDLSRLIARL
jgi:heptosyltransferase-2